jgi:hypothetical protein
MHTYIHTYIHKNNFRDIELVSCKCLYKQVICSSLRWFLGGLISPQIIVCNYATFSWYSELMKFLKLARLGQVSEGWRDTVILEVLEINSL